VGFDVEVFPADRWTAEVADRIEAVVGDRDAPRITMPTGNTPKPVYDELVRRQPDWSHVTMYLLDEFGGVPADHPARCEPMLRRDLLDRLQRPPTLRTFDIDAADLDAELAAYEAELEATPLDLVVLGLGRNGHVGLNEPGSAIDTPTRVVELADATRESAAHYGEGGPPPTWGITMGIGTMRTARQIWLLVTGAGKAEVLDRVLSGPVTPDLPATLLQKHPNATVMADDQALSR
jgi:glucosamine-6-phosphate deaminase